MSTRASPEDVKGIIDFNPSIEDLNPFIEAANELVTELCGGIARYSVGRLKMIETWLAAHFLAIRDPRYASETMGAASASYQQQVGLNLALTPYGQQARLLDTAGGLAWVDQHIAQGKRATVGIVHLGSCKSQYINYPWRFFGLGEV